MLSNSIFFTFQSIFVFYSILTFITLVVSYTFSLGNSLIILVALLFNLLIIYLISFLKKYYFR